MDSAPEAQPPAPEADEHQLQQARFERRCQALLDAMHALLRDYQRQEVPVKPEQLSKLTLQLTLEADPANDWQVSFEPGLAQQLARELESLQHRSGRFVDGAVYSFYTDSNTDPLCRPPSLTEVFSGYSPNGQPQWQELAQALVDQQDDRAHLLYERGAPVITLVQLGKSLKSALLPSYGKTSRTFSLLGQVVAGYFKVPPSIPLPPGVPNRAALTFQVVETRTEDGKLKLELNTVVGGMTDSQRLEWLASRSMTSVYRAREVARRSLDRITREAWAARTEGDMKKYQASLQRVGGILRSLSASLERGDRQGKRRTRHVEDRKRDPRRATHKALEDAGEAGVDAWFFDQRHRTWVVCNERGRAHAFAEDGRHVTSFRIKPDAVEFRVRTERFVPAEPDRVAQLREVLYAPPPDAPSSKPESRAP